MKQVYIPYWKWEEFNNGMYSIINNESAMTKKVLKFMSNYVIFGNAMKFVIFNWNNTMLHNLTNTHINRRAFLGQCACSYKLKCPDYITKKAWKLLTDNQRQLANNEAQKLIDSWIYDYTNRRVCKNMGNQMLFKWDS